MQTQPHIHDEAGNTALKIAGQFTSNIDIKDAWELASLVTKLDEVVYEIGCFADRVPNADEATSSAARVEAVKLALSREDRERMADRLHNEQLCEEMGIT